MPPLAELIHAMEDALEARLPDVEEFQAYYIGNQRLAFATTKFRETFGALLAPLADNWCQLVVDAAVERLQVYGFRFGPGSEGPDEDAWAIWQANYLDADQRLVHTEASKTGIAYLLVLPGDDPETPRVTVEHPGQVITYAAPENRRRRLAALKRWQEDDGSWQGRVYTPERIYELARGENTREWSQRAANPNPIGEVPVVPMRNLPGMLAEGMSDLQAVIPLQDAINKLLADMLVNSEFVAYPQRWATGLDIPTDPVTGRALDREAFLSSVSRLWVAENKDVQFGQLAGSDGLGYVRQIEALVQHIAAQSRTPPHYLLGQQGSFPSGESLKATETGLVAKVKAKQVTYGESWEEAMRLAFAYRDDPRASITDAETIWADPESRAEAQLVDALVKMVTSVGMPMEAAWARYGASPSEVAAWRVLKGLPERPMPGDDAPGGPLAPPDSQPTPTTPPQE